MKRAILWSPWRMKYISKSREKADCIFCRASSEKDDEKNYVIQRGKFSFAMLNAFPYTTGHLMIAPYDHSAHLEKAKPEVLLEIMQIAQKCINALREIYKPDGFNIGFNLGRTAGAGIEDHYHLHIVPRWDGDTNFMTAIGNTRVMPEELKLTHKKLTQQLRKQ
jgi:ATP adenylyltransferase